MAINSFRGKKFEDFEIVDDLDHTVGHIRVKPSGVLWAPRDARVWHGVTLGQFAKYMIENGKKQKK
jgi:hypothetical protein